MWLMTLVEHGIRDVRYATRALARDRGFTGVAVATLALGLGANTAIFAVLYNAVLRPLPYERPESLTHVRRLATTDQRGARPVSFSYSEYVDLSRDTRAFEAVAAYARRVLTLSGHAHPEPITAEIVSPSYLPLLGIQPALGRTFTADGLTPRRRAVARRHRRTGRPRAGVARGRRSDAAQLQPTARSAHWHRSERHHDLPDQSPVSAVPT